MRCVAVRYDTMRVFSETCGSQRRGEARSKEREYAETTLEKNKRRPLDLPPFPTPHPPLSPRKRLQTMKGIEENFGVALDLSTEGRAVVFSENAENVAGAVKLVRELVHEIEEVRIRGRGKRERNKCCLSLDLLLVSLVVFRIFRWFPH